MANELDLALHILYTAVDMYPCEGCVFANSCTRLYNDDVCVIKKAFDTVHVELLRKEEPKNAED